MNERLTIRKLEDCLDSTPAKEFELRSPVTSALMNALAEGASLQYYPHFPKPYFRIEKRHCWVIQGGIGNHTFRVTYMPDAMEREEKNIVLVLENALACIAHCQAE